LALQPLGEFAADSLQIVQKGKLSRQLLIVALDSDLEMCPSNTVADK
jgi:hypothetical protein